ncbi:CIS tube protein [Bradyrhizobium diazoefficiens]|uniref:CIS tube protein n=1 Tax=Bradyrhizobium diazoefficiens TaxID=1355477 RepID=UPI00272D18A2|nr:LysM peptidoglycan-binding domain-containing protein [Bradyrhizobium diazoefficiens]WLA69195.1 LysM peptidoglycan-binding domain-containing protein [Bradyrhizobium diazoefficiens]
MAQELAKAKVRVLDGRNQGREVEVVFNPTEYNLEISNSYQEAAPPGLSNPILQFVNGQTQVLTMDLLFDTYTDGGSEDVSELTRAFADMLAIDAAFHAPPRVEFKWGVFAFKAVVEKLSQRFTMFRSDGIPVRATLNVTFKQFRSLAEQLEEPRRNSADKTKRRVFTTDDRLCLLAFREYKEPKYWHVIAAHNELDDPFALAPGDVLTLPPLDEDDLRGAAHGS